MSDVVMPTVPPPPPAPPPAAPEDRFDFVKSFTFVFEDPEWLAKVLLGGLFYLASFLIVGIFFILGYLAQLTRNVVAGHERPLPSWDRLGDFFAEGLRLFVVALAYSIPIILLVLTMVVPAILLDNSSHSDLGGLVVGCTACCIFPILLVFWLFMPAAFLFAIVDQQIGAAFDFARIIRFVRANTGNYLLAIVTYLVAHFASQFGIIFLCVGVVFTAFWSLLVTMHAFGQTYRLAKVR